METSDRFYRGSSPTFWGEPHHCEWMARNSPETLSELNAAVGGRGLTAEGVPDPSKYSVEKSVMGHTFLFPRGCTSSIKNAHLVHCVVPESVTAEYEKAAREAFLDENDAEYEVLYLSGDHWGEAQIYVADFRLAERVSPSDRPGLWPLFRKDDLGAIRHGISTGDYGGYSEPEKVERLREKSADVQLGYALRHLNPRLIKSIRRVA